MTDVGTQHEECIAQLQRERADFLNYKRRVDRERAEDRSRTREELLQDLVPAIDDLDRALSVFPAELRSHPWAEGIALAHQHLLDALRHAGVERLGAEGEPFDPSVHDAVVYTERPGVAEPQVEEVVRHGYRSGSRVLRAAQVVVAGPPRNERHGNDG
jgi:molecular chaperone GrpE